MRASPSCRRRTRNVSNRYDRAALLKAAKLGADAELSWAFVENGAALRAGCEDPFETVDDDDEVVHTERATVEYRAAERERRQTFRPALAASDRGVRLSLTRATTPAADERRLRRRYAVDARGVPSATVLVAAAPKNAEREARKQAEKRCYFYLKVFLIGFVALPASLTLFHMGRRAIRIRRTVAVLEDFYARAQPDKVDKVYSIADKYTGGRRRSPPRLRGFIRSRAAAATRLDDVISQVRGLRGAPLQATRAPVPGAQGAPQGRAVPAARGARAVYRGSGRRGGHRPGRRGRRAGGVLGAPRGV